MSRIIETTAQVALEKMFSASTEPSAADLARGIDATMKAVATEYVEKGARALNPNACRDLEPYEMQGKWERWEKAKAEGRMQDAMFRTRPTGWVSEQPLSSPPGQGQIADLTASPAERIAAMTPAQRAALLRACDLRSGPEVEAVRRLVLKHGVDG